MRLISKQLLLLGAVQTTEWEILFSFRYEPLIACEPSCVALNRDKALLQEDVKDREVGFGWGVLLFLLTLGSCHVEYELLRQCRCLYPGDPS